eukprot:11354128-Alexandrium_andersonii.AAC.1
MPMGMHWAHFGEGVDPTGLLAVNGRVGSRRWSDLWGTSSTGSAPHRPSDMAVSVTSPRLPRAATGGWT